MPHVEDELGRRLAAWRAEIEATTDRGAKGLLHYEVGHLLEQSGNDPGALEHYEQARKHAPTFRPALFALTRLLERRRDHKSLVELYAVEGRGAPAPVDQASALVDQAVLYEDFLGRGKQARPLYQKALETDPSSLAAALMLELHLRRAGEAGHARNVAARRARHVKEPVLKRMLHLEAALATEAAGDVDGAIEFLQAMGTEPMERWRVYAALEGLARRQGRGNVLLATIERMAGLAEARGRGENIGQGLTAGSLPPFPNDAAARRHAGALFHEAARLRAALEPGEGEDPAVPARAALDLLERALVALPDDRFLRAAKIDVAAQAGLWGTAAELARALAKQVEGAHGAALELHAADLARAAGDSSTEKSALRAAADRAPASPAVAALVQDRLLSKASASDRLAWIERRGAEQGSHRAEVLWKAGHVAADELGDASRALALYRRAAEAADEPMPILREAHGAALRLGDPAEADRLARDLLERNADDEERAHLLFERYRHERTQEGAQPANLLRDALADPMATGWAPDAARLEGAARDDLPLLAEAHRFLAAGTADQGLASDHLAAAARALGRDGRLDEADEVLRDSLRRSPDHEYGRALLEEVLRARGADLEVAALLEEAARGASPRDAEPLLLRAAAIARSAGDVGLAGALLRQAAERSPASPSPLERLHRLAVTSNDAALEIEALEAMAARESATSRPGRATLSLGERLIADGRDPARAYGVLLSCFHDDVVGPAAAVALLLSPEHYDREAEALERLLKDARGQGAAGLRRTLGGLWLEGPRKKDVRALLPRVRELRRDDRWVSWTAVRLAGLERGAAPARAEALEALGDTTTDEEATLDLAVQARTLVAIAGGETARERVRGLTDRIARRASSGLAALARSEAWLLDEGAEARAEILAARVAVASPQLRPALQAALGRCLLELGRHTEAVATLREVLAKEPDDLSSWEAILVAARQAGALTELVQACDKLAALAQGAPRARLLEEAAFALFDRERRTDAEARLRQALEADPSSELAYQRLHHILRERGDPRALLELVSGRVAAVDDPDELVPLLDEQAQLRHQLGDLEGTVDALRNLQVLDPGNAGALARMAESHARLEQWAEAVHALRQLSCMDIPAEDRRQARLAAARHAVDRLGERRSALADLAVIDGMGLADEDLYVFMARLAEESGEHATAAEALTKAARLATDGARARHWRRAAALYTDPLLDADRAVAAYLSALEADPTDLPTAEGLAALLDGEDRREVASAFQEAVRRSTAPEDPAASRKLARSATWAGQRDLELRALDALVALGHASAEDRRRRDDLVAEAPRRSTTTLGDVLRESHLRVPGSHPAIRAFTAIAEDAVAAVDGLELGALGVGRGDLVRPDADHPVRDEIVALAATLGVGCERFFEGGADPSRVEAVPQDDQWPVWIAGAGIDAPLSPAARFRIGALAAAVRDGATGILRRTPGDAVGLVYALAAASDAPLPAAPPSADALVGPLRKALSRKARKQLADAAPTLRGSPDVIGAHCRAEQMTAWRTGAVLAGALEPALHEAPPGVHGELIAFWVSSEAGEVRRALGLALEDARLTDVEVSEPTAERAPPSVRHDVSAEHLLRLVVAQNPYAGKERAATQGAGAAGPVSRRERVALLLQLAEQAAGRVGARLSVAAAELLEEMGGREPAMALVAEALRSDPDDPVAMRRMRAELARAGRFEDVLRLLEREAALPVTPEERALLLSIASTVAMVALGDAKAAENAARRAFMIRPQSALSAAWLAEIQQALGQEDEAMHTLERAATATRDGALGAVWLVETARAAERKGDRARARRLFRQAQKLDGEALDAAIGLARTARAESDAREAAAAAQHASTLATDQVLREAFSLGAARIAHRLGRRPADAMEMLAEGREAPAAFARVEAARDGRDRDAHEAALEAAVEVTRRTDKAQLLAELAEVRAEAGNLPGALAALREAGQADQTLTTLRVLREELARRTGDPLEIARATRAAGEGPLAAAARAALSREALEVERGLLAEAVADPRTQRTAGILSLDAAAEAKDRQAATELLGLQPSGIGPRLALADRHLAAGREQEAREVLLEVRALSPHDVTARRWLARLVKPAEAAALWLEEAGEASGGRGAFASTVAGRLLAAAGDAGGARAALERALEASPGYPPALWTLEAEARHTGDVAALRELLTGRAEALAGTAGAAEVLVRGAMLGEVPDGALLQRAHDAAPDDPVLADLRARVGGDLSDAERGELHARAAEGASDDWARALRLRSALAFERARAFGEAVAQTRLALAAAGGTDPIAERMLDRLEPLAGELDSMAERLLARVAGAPDDISRALAFERYAELEVDLRGDLEAAASPLYGILEQYPGHVATLRTLERLFMTVDDDGRLKEVEERFASLGHPQDAAAHARLVARLSLRIVGADGSAADTAVRAAFDYAEVDTWLLRRAEAMARSTGDARLLVQVLTEMSERLDEDPNEQAAMQLRLAEAIAEARSPAAATGRLARVAREHPGYPLLDEHLARLHAAAGSAMEAAEAFEAAARAARATQRQLWLFHRAGVLWDEQVMDPARAAEAFGEVASRDLDYQDVFARLRRMLPALGETAKLADLVERSLATARGSRQRLIDLHLLLAALSHELGDLETAKKSLRTVVTMDPRNAEVLQRLASVCSAEGDWRGAIDALTRITRATQEPAVLHPTLMELGALYQRTRNVPRAEQAYKQALDLFPDDAAARERLDALRAR